MIDDLSETDRIERDLARTRARMDGRLDELQGHLAPKQMLNDALAYFRGGAGADFTSDLIRRAKANPIPIALTAVGISWLMLSNRGPAPLPSADDNLAARIRRAEATVERLEHDDDESYAGRLNNVRGEVLGIAREASETMASFAQRIEDAIASALQSARDTAYHMTSGASEMLGQIGDRAATQGAQFQEGTMSMARSARDAMSSVAGNPLALGAVAAAVGIVAGALLPTLEEEEAALGAIATKVREGGRDLAQDVVDRGGRVVADTLEAVQGSADAHGLTAERPIGELVGEVRAGKFFEGARAVAEDTLQAGRDSAVRNLSNPAPQQPPDDAEPQGA